MKVLATLTLIRGAPLETVRALLPLVAAQMFTIECVELRPFVNWSMLFAR